MKVGIIGVGNVGSAVRHGFIRMGHDISVYDTKLPETSLVDVLNTDIVFISVPTPPAEDGSCDTSIVKKVVDELASAHYNGLVTIKSTVEPGTSDSFAEKYPHMRFAFCPEFLRERAMYIDFVENHDVCIIGTYTSHDANLLRDVHSSLPKQFAFVTPMEAELAKYFINVFNALRIVYANQFYDVCKIAGADYKKVKDAVVKHRNVQDVYLDCNENVRGFGGACLPKDTKAFANYARKIVGDDLDLSLFDGIVEINQRYKPTVW
jgi:UDPglucose 6-dehydrogenase